MENIRVLVCSSSLQASPTSCSLVAGVKFIRRSPSFVYRVRRERRLLQSACIWSERSCLILGNRREQRRITQAVRSCSDSVGSSDADERRALKAEEINSGSESEGIPCWEDPSKSVPLGNETEARSSFGMKQVLELKKLLTVNWARLHVIGLLTIVAVGIGAGTAAASVPGTKLSRRYVPPCFASVSSVSDKSQDSKDQGAAVKPQDPTVVHDQAQASDGSQELLPATEGAEASDSGVEMKEVKNMRDESDEDKVQDEEYLEEDEDEDEDEDEYAESDVGAGSDDEGMNYPTIGDLEDLDDLGELASGAAAAELLSGSGEIESAEAERDREPGGDTEDEELKKAFEEWKAKPYALTVPLRIVGLRGSVPPAWLKEFLMSQGKNAKLSAEFKGGLSDILADLAVSMENNHITPKSAMAADLVTVGDSWLATAVQGGLLDPIRNAEQFDWFNRLHPKWQNFIRRDSEGIINPQGLVWGVPYRWGSLVFAFKKDKLERNGIAPIRDWNDLFQPQLAGRIAMVDSPREVVGAVLKSLGASYNTNDFDADVPGGREAVKERFLALQKQVRLFDDNDYLKAMSAGDVWVAVGWSSDVIPYSKRASNISVHAPESGTSLWADLWAIPATTTFEKAENVGGRVRGPSPLVFQWFDFCLQPARATTFANDVFVGASPLTWSEKRETETSERTLLETGASQSVKKPKTVVTMDSNIVQGMPPDEIVAKSEFLEPLSDKALSDYQWLLSASVGVEGWPSTFNEYLKGIALSLMQWRNRDGSRG